MFYKQLLYRSNGEFSIKLTVQTYGHGREKYLRADFTYTTKQDKALRRTYRAVLFYKYHDAPWIRRCWEITTPSSAGFQDVKTSGVRAYNLRGPLYLRCNM